jgi:putative Ca2+/H+ antiporter (TMEM165/GDT1 family)
MAEILTIFLTVFIAELGDKTQIATLLFASDKEVNSWFVFLAAAAALVASTALAVALGSLGSRYLEMLPLKLIAGCGFIAIGAWTLVEHFRGAA